MNWAPPSGAAAVGHGARLALAAWLTGLFIVTAFKAISGAPWPGPRTGLWARMPLHMHKLQLLAATWAVGGYYACAALLGKSGGAMPDISPFVLGLLGASQTTYLSGKAVRTIAAQRRRRRRS